MIAMSQGSSDPSGRCTCATTRPARIVAAYANVLVHRDVAAWAVSGVCGLRTIGTLSRITPPVDRNAYG